MIQADGYSYKKVGEDRIKTTLISPCLNEEKAIARFIKSAKPYVDEIIIVDNGSTDKSKQIAEGLGVIVLDEQNRGYGNAYKTGLKYAKGDKVIMMDCDWSYDPRDIPKFIKELDTYDFVLGNRFAHPDKRSMPILNQFGNGVLRKVLKYKGLDFQEVCTGMVGIKKDCLPDLFCEGMEFSSEFLLKTKDLNSKEIPIRFHRRIGKPKLRRFRDGYRHLNYILKR